MLKVNSLYLYEEVVNEGKGNKGIVFGNGSENYIPNPSKRIN